MTTFNFLFSCSWYLFDHVLTKVQITLDNWLLCGCFLSFSESKSKYIITFTGAFNWIKIKFSLPDQHYNLVAWEKYDYGLMCCHYLKVCYVLICVVIFSRVHVLMLNYREMLTSALRIMVKKANIIRLHWNLCIQLLKNLKSDIFN